jgi:hypothetical protein
VTHTEKHELASNHILSNELSDEPGKYLLQVNIFSQKKHAWVREVEDLPVEDWRLYSQRMIFTRRAMQNKDHHEGRVGEKDYFFNLISSWSGIRWPYANAEMKAYFILR